MDALELRRDGQVIPIRKKAIEVLDYLIEHHDRVVTKQELLDKYFSFLYYMISISIKEHFNITVFGLYNQFIILTMQV